MISARSMIRTLGNEPPLLADGRRAPDRREISLRWLSGTFLTGITSSILMGVALFAALDGRQQLAIPAEASVALPLDADTDSVTRGNRLLAGNIVAMPTDRKVMEVSTVVQEGQREVIRRRPFAHVKMNLAANHVAQEDYPAFDPLTIFASSEEPDPAPGSTGMIYGSEVESEVSLRALPFPKKGAAYPFASSMTLDEVEENVRSNGSILTAGNTQLSALYYVDPRRFSSHEDEIDITAGLTARIVEQNMTVTPAEPVTPKTRDYADDVIPIRTEKDVRTALTDVGYPDGKAEEIAGHLGNRMKEPTLYPGDVLRIGVLQQGDMVLVVRASVYRRGQHEVTIALNDHGRIVDAEEPPALDAVAGAFDEQPPQLATGRDLPRVYDGIYRASLSYGMTTDMTGLLVKLLASSVDLQAQLKPTDKIEAFFSVQDESGQATDQSELLYVNAHFGDTTTRFYRFQDPEDGSVDYFDGEGKSIRQFLLRNPVPNGRMTSGFGMRRHPILGFSRMHTGTDWAASRGTPIIASGNGTVESAGWSSGYGNQTIIRHANGYESSYNHQSAIAKGVKPGAKVTQGQVIGYVGSTGLSTGAHLHYELIVNGTKVDPMKIRLPGGKSLAGDDLARFKDERSRIDALLGTGGDPAEVASR
ncbi:M23 family metallopeptidase [Pseudorhizobium marinum]|uniref:M23 family metallopeptidase n=1 Tax=Pseudorhizobium marinum TaxID=1496690 RepID=UPI0004964BCD|nr:M23 family metallopeptidase [Pseudorhizobium marinum]MDY6963386.1 M23 family metallopeptidase [Pseudomonadota bacterium]|tara:strand:+ start:366 stop:2303 length:1938 start_codon:yes stop_codon:yes gene_type:complete